MLISIHAGNGVWFFEGLTIKAFKAGIDHLKEIYIKDQPKVKDYIYDRIVSMLYETY